jgi:hypothetical protein
VQWEHGTVHFHPEHDIICLIGWSLAFRHAGVPIPGWTQDIKRLGLQIGSASTLPPTAFDDGQHAVHFLAGFSRLESLQLMINYRRIGLLPLESLEAGLNDPTPTYLHVDPGIPVTNHWFRIVEKVREDVLGGNMPFALEKARRWLRVWCRHPGGVPPAVALEHVGLSEEAMGRVASLKTSFWFPAQVIANLWTA